MYSDQEKQQILDSCKLTPKENFLRVVNGEVPESVPIWNYGVLKDLNGDMCFCNIGPNLFNETHLYAKPGGFLDSWGVEFACNESTNFAPIPAPGSALLTIDDVDHWRDFVQVPQLPDHIDWEMMAKKDIEASGIDRNTTAAMGLIGVMPFQELIALMGFEDCFMALYEEPEAIHEILQEMINVYLPICEACVQYYKPDAAYLLDDTATQLAPFISMEMYEEFLLPVYMTLSKPFRDAGIPLEFHNCGNCSVFLPHMIELGVKIWDPAQTMNDLASIRKQYGKDLVIAGGWDWVPPSDTSGIDHEVVHQMVVENIDKYALNGPYMASMGTVAAFGDDEAMRINGIFAEELFYYTRGYYNRHHVDAFPEGIG